MGLRVLDPVLLGDVGLVHRAAAVGAGVGQWRLVDLVDLVGAGRLAVCFGAVVRAALAARLLGLAGGRSLGEGGGLALAGAGRLVELAAEALVLGLQVAEASLKGLAAGTRDGLHTPIIGEARAAAAIPRPRSRDRLELDALNNLRSRGGDRGKGEGKSGSALYPLLFSWRSWGVRDDAAHPE